MLDVIWNSIAGFCFKVYIFSKPSSIKLMSQRLVKGLKCAFKSLKNIKNNIFAEKSSTELAPYSKNILLILCSIIIIPLIYEHALISILKYTDHLIYDLFNFKEEQFEPINELYNCLSFLFKLIYSIPVIITVHLITTYRFQEIADNSSKKRRETETVGGSMLLNLSDFYCDCVFQFIIYIQWMILRLLPLAYFTPIMALCFHSWIISYYAHFYKMISFKKARTHHRAGVIEWDWPFHLGFGLPTALLLWCLEDTLFGPLAFGILFPLLITQSMENGKKDKPKTDRPKDQKTSASVAPEKELFDRGLAIPFFSIGVKLANQFTKITVPFLQSVLTYTIWIYNHLYIVYFGVIIGTSIWLINIL